MKLELDSAEVELLLGVLEAADRDRLHQIHHAAAREFRERLRSEADLIERLRARLAGRASGVSHREEILDESVEESFPASDPPARSSARGT